MPMTVIRRVDFERRTCPCGNRAQLCDGGLCLACAVESKRIVDGQVRGNAPALDVPTAELVLVLADVNYEIIRGRFRWRFPGVPRSNWTATQRAAATANVTGGTW
jgi:hypothetical protein